MSTELTKIYKKLYSTIIKIYKTYSFLGLTKEMFIDLTKEFIKDIYEKNQTQDLSEDYYKENLQRYLYVYIKVLLEDENKSIEIINNFINQKLTIKESSKENIKELIKLYTFLKKYECILNPDICIELIKTNNKLNKIINKIIKENTETILNKGIYILNNNELFIQLIENYCTIYQINYKHSEENIEDLELLSGLDEHTLNSLELYIKEANKKILSQEELNKLFIKMESGDKTAKNLIIEHNLKLVIYLARKNQYDNIDLLELIQEGNIGLIKAVEKYDYKKGFTFSTYATWWIKQSINKAIIKNKNLIRLPDKLNEQVTYYEENVSKLQIKLGRNPTIKELAKYLKCTEKQIKQIILYSSPYISLNTKINEDTEEELLTLIEPEESTIETRYIERSLSIEIQKLLKKCNLNEKEIQVLLLRNGFYGYNSTLEKIGKIYGISRERVRQIETTALKKIRTSTYIEEIISFLNDEETAYRTLELFRNYYKENASSVKSFHNRETEKKMKKLSEITFEEEKTEDIQEIPKKRYAFFTIFDKFEEIGYTKEEILAVIEELPEQDKRRIYLRNGNNLDKPIISANITDKDRKLYITSTLPTIEKNLIIKYGKRPKIKRIKVEETIFKHMEQYGYTPNEILSILEFLPNIDKKRIEQFNGSDLYNPTREIDIPKKTIESYEKITLPNIKKTLRKKYGYRKKQTNKNKN